MISSWGHLHKRSADAGAGCIRTACRGVLTQCAEARGIDPARRGGVTDPACAGVDIACAGVDPARRVRGNGACRGVDPARRSVYDVNGKVTVMAITFP